MAISTKVRWGDRKTVVATFGLSQRRLNACVGSGHIRVAKLGSCQQSPKLYCIQDVEDVLRALAAGRPLGPPVVGTGHAKEGEDEQ